MKDSFQLSADKSQFPKGWEVKKLGDLCEIKTGRRDANHGNPNGIYHFFTCARDHSYIDDYNFDTEAILIAGNGDVGAVKYFKGKFDAYQRTYVLKDFETTINVQFLFLLLDGYLKDTVAKQKLGNTMPYIKVGMLKNFQVPLPPLPEQQRIVEILDKAFATIDKAKRNGEQNLRNAKEVFENYLQGVFDDETIQWDKFILKDLLQEQPRNGWSPPLKYHSDIGIPVLTLSAVTGFEFDVEKCKYTTAPTDEASYYWLKNGDLLISRSNTPELVGHVAISNNIESPTIYPDLIMKMKPKQNLVSTSFLYYQLRSSNLRKEIMMRAHGANPTMKKINKTDVQSLPILLCNKNSQNQIVSNLDQLLEKIKVMEGIYQRKINSIQKLKKSILQKAFRGEL